MLVGLLVFVAVGFTWYMLVWRNNPAVIEEWKREVTREGATGLPPSKWYAYGGLVLHMFPWGFFLVAGLIGAATIAVRRRANVQDDDEARERASRIVLPLMLLLVAVLVMSFFRDRELRYLIPLLGPASVVAAWGMLDLLVTHARRFGTSTMLALFHWLPLAIVAIGLPIVASPMGRVRTMEGEAWYSFRWAIVAAEVFAVIIVGSIWLRRRWPVGTVAWGTALVMLIWGVVLHAGYRYDREGRSELRPLAEQILASQPDATVYSFRPDRPIRKAPIDLSIYLNRVIENLPDLDAGLEATRGPQRVLLIRYKADQPAPPPPASWTQFAATPNDDSVWYAYTPPAEHPSTAPATAPAPDVAGQ